MTDEMNNSQPARNRRSERYAAQRAESSSPQPAPENVSANAQSASNTGRSARQVVQQPFAWQQTASQPVRPQQPQPQPGRPVQDWQYGGGQNAWQGAPMQGWQQHPAQGGGYVPPYPPQQGGQAPQNGNPQPAKPQKKKQSNPALRKALKWVILAVVVAGVAFAAVQGIQQIRERQRIEAVVSPYDTLYCEGVYVDGIHLGGMTQEEARQAVTSQAEAINGSWSVQLTYQGQLAKEITSADLGITVNVDDVLQSAWAQGHVGSTDERYEAMLALQASPYYAYSSAPSGNTSAIDTILNDLAQEVYRAPQDASLASFDPAYTYPFLFNDEVVGRTLDVEPIKNRLYVMLANGESGEVEIEPTLIQPSVTVAQLKETYGTLRGTGVTEISYRSTEERNNNIRRAFELITGTVIQPGKQFSFNSIVGERTERNGFYPAIEYAYGQESSGIGGGVCQASTTVYLAAVRAGLTIVHREPHSDAVNYTAYGKDATVYWYSNHRIDLVFENNTDHPIYIQAAVQSSQKNRSTLACYVNIYGESLGNVTYDIETEETELPAPTEPEYVKDTKGTYVIYTDQTKVVREASKGAKVVSYRVKYIDGVAQFPREYLYEDTYEPRAQRIYVGVKNR